MAIHGTGSPIYASEIQAEFGGGNPMYLSNYYAGGPYVPAGCSGQNGPIPSSGYIDYWHFYGAAKAAAYTVGVGYWAAVPSYYGYLNGLMGWISPTGFPTGGTIVGLWWNTDNMVGLNTDALVGNGGWSTIVINGYGYARSSALYTQDSGGTVWRWTGTGNPFGTSGNIGVTIS